jgi:hypothetical protein
MSPLFGVGALAVLDGLLPSLIDDAETLAQQGAQGSIDDPHNGVALPAPWDQPLPGLSYPKWGGAINYISIAKSTLDLGVNTMPDVDLTALPHGTISPAIWDARDKKPIKISLKLRQDLENLGGENLMLSWKVRRADTNEIVIQSDVPYNNPDFNGVKVDHHSKDLYFVDAYEVSCTATLTLGNQVGQIWFGRQTITIYDNLDRHHKYVQWGPHTVYFKNQGTDGEWWSHNRISHIHRTAVSPRCLMLRIAATDGVFPGGISYLDELPFAWQYLNGHRKPLCEYCFFGGPDKTDPFPEHDWF